MNVFLGSLNVVCTMLWLPETFYGALLLMRSVMPHIKLPEMFSDSVLLVNSYLHDIL